MVLTGTYHAGKAKLSCTHCGISTTAHGSVFSKSATCKKNHQTTNLLKNESKHQWPNVPLSFGEAYLKFLKNIRGLIRFFKPFGVQLKFWGSLTRRLGKFFKNWPLWLQGGYTLGKHWLSKINPSRVNCLKRPQIISSNAKSIFNLQNILMESLRY